MCVRVCKSRNTIIAMLIISTQDIRILCHHAQRVQHVLLLSSVNLTSFIFKYMRTWLAGEAIQSCLCTITLMLAPVCDILNQPIDNVRIRDTRACVYVDQCLPEV